MKEYVKILNAGTQKYAFDGNTLKLYRVSSEEELKSYIAEEEVTQRKAEKKGFLNKVVINVSNKCNLNCKYCYAEGGNYGRKDDVMSVYTLDKIVEELISENVTNIRIVSFFGGEPTINFKLIEYALPIFARKFNVLNFEVVTNGTLLTDRMISFFRDNGVRLSISIDGPKEITDDLRGRGVYERAKRSIERCKELSYTDIELSATYTYIHEKYGYEYDTTRRFLKRFEVPFTLSRVITSDENLKVKKAYTKEQLEKSVRDSFRAIYTNDKAEVMNPYVYNVLLSVFEGAKSQGFCDDLMDSSITYDYDGKKYSCFRFWNDEQMQLPKTGGVQVINKANNKDNYRICKTCWARNLCKVCIAAILQGVGDYPFDNEKCVDQQAYEMVLLELIKYIESGKHNEIATNFDRFFVEYK